MVSDNRATETSTIDANSNVCSIDANSDKSKRQKYLRQYHRRWQMDNPAKCAEYSKRHYEKTGSECALVWFRFWEKIEERRRGDF